MMRMRYGFIPQQLTRAGANNTLLYGFTEYEDLADRRVTEVGAEVIIEAIEQSAAEYNRQLAALMASFVEQTTEFKIRYKQAGSGTLQPLDESGNPKAVREQGYYDVEFPIQGGGTAWGTNRVSRAKLTVQEANEFTLNSMRRDSDWVRRHVLAAVFTNANWTWNDDDHGDLTIKPLANSDAVEYVKVGGSMATDTHYLAQADAIDDSHNPFDDIYDELMEHAGNSGPVVVYIPTNLKATVEALTTFTEVGDPDLRYGVNTDLVDTPIDRGLGDEVLGKADKCWIVEWRALPDSYMIGHAVGGGAPVAMRVHEEAELQGFFAEAHSIDGNLEVTRMLRYAGFGVIRRAAALIYRVGNAAYAIPTGYTAPLSV